MMFYQRRMDTAFKLRAAPARLRIPTAEKDISLLKEVRTSSVSQAAF
jgi:hypothetical protein